MNYIPKSRLYGFYLGMCALLCWLLASQAGGHPQAATHSGSHSLRLKQDPVPAANLSVHPEALAGITLMSRAGDGGSSATPNNSSFGLGNTQLMSTDGRFLVFTTFASNVIPGEIDPNGTGTDIFLFDRQTNALTLVSHNASSLVTTGDGSASGAAISGDGNWIAYTSNSTNIIPGQVDTNLGADVFLYNRSTGATTLVTHAAGSATTAANGSSSRMVISNDGNLIAFASGATNLVTGITDTNNRLDTFIFNRSADTMTLVSHNGASMTTTANDTSEPELFSDDGNFLVLESQASNVVTGQTDPNGTFDDIFLYNRATGTNALISHNATSMTTTTNNVSGGANITADGSLVLYFSAATDVVPGQIKPAAGFDIYLYSRQSGTSTLVSHVASSALTTAGAGRADMTPDGSLIMFESSSSNIVPGQVDQNNGSDVFTFSPGTGTYALVTHVPGSPLTTISTSSIIPRLSRDGSTILFQTRAPELVPGLIDPNPAVTSKSNVIAYRRSFDGFLLVSHALDGANITANEQIESRALSQNGNVIYLDGSASNLVPNDTNSRTDAFVAELACGTPTATLSGTGTICTPGNPATITATVNGGTPPFRVSLNNGGGTQTSLNPTLTFTVNPAVTTTYSVTAATDGFGCAVAASGSTTVTVNTPPSLGTFATTTVNAGNNVTLTPATALTDTENNISVVNLTPLTFGNSGTAAVNPTTGTISVTTSHTTLPGTYSFIVTATDTCTATVTRTASLTVINQMPTITAGATLTRQQGSSGTAATLAVVNDAETPLASLVVTPVTVPPGLTLTGFAVTTGTVSATVTASCSATVGANTVTLRVQDGAGQTAMANLTVNVTPNTAPVLGTYADMNVVAGTPLTVAASAAPTDNGTVATVTVAASGVYAGTLTVNPATGMVTALPANDGTFTITVTAIDNCGATTSRSFILAVLPFGKNPSITGLSPNTGTVGTSVTISGFNLGQVDGVFFNGRAASFTVDSSTQITATVPAGATTGPVSLTASGGSSTGPVFTVIRSK
ncbi:MAG: hypothetical protein K1Y36_20800 [Blastocatellia bacterium]|nr:hypothetical protein [Blastocatellia bacterium]